VEDRAFVLGKPMDSEPTGLLIYYSRLLLK